MSIEVKVPGFPESVADGTVVTWHKKAGEFVKRDENIVDIETDKVVFEVPAPENGILQEILEQEGVTVVSGQLLARMDPSNGEERPANTPEQTQNQPETIQAEKTSKPNIEIFLTPSARKIITEHNLDASRIQPTGKDGRILKEDVIRFMEESSSQKTIQIEKQDDIAEKQAPNVTTITPAQTVEYNEERPAKRVPMTRLRAKIAERLVEAQQTAAILTTFNEVNMKPVMDLRTKYKDQFEKEHGVRLGFMSFFVRAAIEALKQFPEINASIDDHDIIYHGYFDIGIAVSSPRGLVVPVLRDADQLSMAEIESGIRSYANKAEAGALSIEDITGGTFTITNGGTFGSMLSTPILNPPQSGILGMHKIQEKPVVIDGEIVIRPMMYLALSYDHRIVDGRGAVQFLVTIKELLEDPARMLLDI